MIRLLIKSIAPLALVLTLLVACQSAPLREPREDFSAAEDFKSRGVTDIVVLPIDASAPARPGESENERLPAVAMRQMLRDYLIQQKHYAAPTATWVDGRKDRGEAWDTDALLGVSVDQWDTSALEQRGVVYVSALFELKSPGGESLWRYRCNDMQLSIAGARGAERSAEDVHEAARLLTETALSRLPHK
ncbi:MAG: hypothetical protein H6807_11955 [Planctomycetes bacterium]|nr:hypothetical protein [Planctomycetota bacterium]